ncbi:hypothetical protein [Myxococcus stipitatus]|uniref:hypothetical protein n=1 Tax=Myxococcus stipitatus TaxID=83455 RepID=UPI0030D180B6
MRKVPGVREVEEVVVEAGEDVRAAHDRFAGDVAASMSPYSLRARAHPEEGLYARLGAETDARAQEIAGPALREGYQAAAQAAAVATGALKNLDEVGEKVSARKGREATKDIVLSGEQKTLSLSGKWYETEWLSGQEGIVYVLRDARSGEILKVGKTEVSAFDSRFQPYARAGRRTGRELELDAWAVPMSSERTIESLEGDVRRHLESQGHLLPWDNTNSRLGRPGPGVPGVYQSSTAKKGFHWNGDSYTKKE